MNNNHKREFIQSDNTHSSIHCQQLNTTLQRQKQASYQRPNNSRRTTTPSTAADLVAATAGDGHNNTNYDNTIFTCNGGGRHRPLPRDDEIRSTRGSRKRRISSTPPPSIPSSILASTTTNTSLFQEYTNNNIDDIKKRRENISLLDETLTALANKHSIFPNDTNYKDDLSAARELKDLLFNSDRHVKAVEKLRKRSFESLSSFEKIALCHLHIQQYVDCRKKNIHSHYRMRYDINEALIALGFSESTNMGDEINPDALLAIILHFATEKEMKVFLGLDGLSKMNFMKSACIRFMKLMLSGSLVREYARTKLKMSEEDAQQYWESNKDRILGAITMVDFRFFISKDKDDFDKEVTELANKDKTSIEVLDILGMVNINYHNLDRLLKTNGKEKLSNILASITLHKTVLDRCESFENAVTRLIGVIAHSEPWLAGYLANLVDYPDKRLCEYENVIARGFAPIFKQILNAAPFFETRIAHRFANGELTPAEAKALLRLLLAIRSKGGTTLWMMRSLIAAIMNFIECEQEDIENEAAIKLVPSKLEALCERYKSEETTPGAAGALLIVMDSGYLNQDEVNEVKIAYPSVPTLNMVAAFDALIYQQPNKLKEKIPKLAKKMISLYRGGTIRDLMNTLSSTKVFESIGLNGSSSEEDVTAVLEKLKSSSSSDNEASVAFDILVKHKPTLLNELPKLAAKLLSKHRGNSTKSLIKKLSVAIFESSSNDLGDTSCAEDVKAVLEKLNSSPDSNNEASVVFDKLKLYKHSISSELPALSTKLLSIHRDRVKASKVKAEKAQTQAANRQAVLLADQYMAKLRIKGYERQEVTAVKGSLGVTMTNTPGSGLLYVSQIKSNSQLKDKVIVGDVVFCLDGHFVYHTSHLDMKKLVYDKRENPVRVFEIWRRSE